MSRIAFQYILPFLLPTLLWLLWWVALGRHRTHASGGLTRLEHGPWFWLVLAGLALLGASLVYTALTQGFDPSGRYIAPRWEGGRVVPGRIE